MKKRRKANATLESHIAEQALSVFAKFVLIALQAICLTLLVPFHWPTLIGAALFLAIGYMLYKILSRKRRTLAVSSLGIAALLAVVWAGVGPVLLSPVPVYIFLDKELPIFDRQIFSSSLAPLERNGTLFLVTDPIRSHLLLPALKELFPTRIREMKPKSVGDRKYVQMPLRSAHRKSITTTTGTEIATFLTITMPRRSIIVEGAPEKIFASVQIGFGFGNSILLTFGDSGAPGEAVWDLVEINAEKSGQLRYAALLDRALEEAANGNSEHASDLLWLALKNAPSREELARASCFFASHVRKVLDGNLGALQSLQLTHQCFRTLEALAASAENRKNWLQRWTANELISQYGPYKVFANRNEKIGSAFLGTEGPIVFENGKTQRKHGPHDYLMTLYRQAMDEMRENDAAIGSVGGEIKRLGKLPNRELQEELRQVSGSAKAMKIELSLLSLEEGAIDIPLEVIDARLTLIEKELLAMPAEYVTLGARRMDWARKQTTMQAHFARGDYARYMESLVSLVKSPPFDNRYDKAYISILSSALSGSTAPTSKFGDDPKARSGSWWSYDFQAWVGFNLMEVLGLSDTNPGFRRGNLKIKDVADAVVDPEQLIVDGANRPFIPSIFFLARLTEGSGGKEHKFFVNELERPLEMKYPELLEYFGLGKIRDFKPAQPP